MKKKMFFSMALAALMLASCSSSDDLNGGETNKNESETSYLAVNIRNVGAASSRATSDYEDGTADETHIENVRFYFFNADGTPYILKNNGVSTGKNWLDKTDNLNTENKQTPNVEMISKTVLVIEGNKGASPATIIAVVNPTTLEDGGLGDKAYAIDEIKKVPTFSTFKTAENKNFVMSNSVYVENGVEKCSSILTNHIKNNKVEAESNPVDIYVERVNAKVRTSIDANYTSTDGRKWEKINGKDAIKVNTYGTKDIYAVVDGWGLADEDGKAELFKQVKTTWNDDDLGINVWTSPDYHRCFWSSSVPFSSGGAGNGNQPVNHSYTDYTGTQMTTPIYTLPNTADQVSQDPYNSYLTKMLVAAHLVYKDGDDYKNAEICQYKGLEYFTISDVKKAILTELQNDKYSVTTTGSDHKDLVEDNIDFETSSSLKDYEVKAVVKLKANEKLQQNTSTNTSTPVYVDADLTTLNTKLANSPAQIRKDGMTYYFIPIQHLATDPTKLGYYGVVRNHIYDITIRNMQGYGTPVYDPNKTIDPTIPSNEDTYLAARINVLSWRVVKQNADLDKTNK